MKRAALFLVLAAATSFGQTPPPTGPSTALPLFDPAAETVTWDGKSWNIANNRLFQSRFEKYLSTPSDTNQDTTEHFKVLSKIRELLSPSRVSPQSQSEAFRLLDQASDYTSDDLLSDAIANQVYSAWLAQKKTALLQSAAETLEKEKKRLEWNMQMVTRGDGLNHPTGSSVPSQQQGAQAIELQQIAARTAEVNLLLRSNQIKKEVSWTQTRTDFQILIVQLFLQRRFQHVLIATRFYRAIFTDRASQQFEVGGEANSMFSKIAGSTPTLSSLDSLCGGLISDAHDGVNAFKTLLAQNELESATKRLSEAFVIGEYLTPLDVVSMPEKHRALVFLQKSNQLLSALQVKDFTLAEQLVNELHDSARDFDTAKANAAIQTAKTMSVMLLAKAKNAAASGNKTTQEAELKAAADLWPTNPALAEVASGIYQQGNVHARARADFDQLVSQRSWRQIYNERMRFIPAVATDPEKQAKLQEVLDNVMTIDRARERAQDLEKRGEKAAAWETAELIFRQFPEEYPRFLQYRADLAVQAADYVQAIHTAEKLESQGELASSLTCYLQAQILYPQGELAKAGIQRVNHLLLPDSW